VLGHETSGRLSRARIACVAPRARRWGIVGVNDVNIILYDVLLGCMCIYEYMTDGRARASVRVFCVLSVALRADRRRGWDRNPHCARALRRLLGRVGMRRERNLADERFVRRRGRWW